MLGPDAARRPRNSISSAPPSIATGWRRCRMSRATRASIRRRRGGRRLRHPSARAGMSCIQVFFFRTGQNWGNRAYFPKADPALDRRRSAGLPSWRSSTTTSPARGMLLLSDDVEEQELLAAGAWRQAPATRCTILVPQRGEKKDLVDHALQNAREALGRRLAETSSQARLLAGLCRDVRAGHVPPRASRSTTTRTSWAPMRSAA